MKKFFASLSFTILSLILFAQTYDQKFGKISMAEMEMKVCPIDSGAAAVVLFDIGESKMVFNTNLRTFQLEFTRHLRVKILNKDAYDDFGNISIPLYHNEGSYENLARFKGYTYNLVNGKIEKFKLDKDSKFDEKKNDNVMIRKFAFPKVQEGSVLECEYTIISDFLFNFQPWRFQYSVPVLYSIYDTYTVDYYKYSSHISGYENVQVKELNPAFRTVQYTWEELDHEGIKRKYSNSFEYKEVKKTYNAINIPALKGENFVDNINNYISKVDFELVSRDIPGQKSLNFSTSWENIAKKFLEFDDFGGQLKKSHLKEKIEALTSSIVKNEDKIPVVLSFIKSMIKWNENHGVFTDKGVVKAFNEGVGNVADVNLNYIIALRNARLEVYPVVLSTISNGKIFDWKKELSGFNYVVAGIKLDGKLILSDATMSNSYIGVLPIKCLNGLALVITDNGNPEWVSLNPKSLSMKRGYYNYKFDSDLKLNGEIANTYRDYFALQLKETISEDDSLIKIKETLSKDFGNGSLSNYKVDINPNSPEAKESFNIISSESYGNTGDMIFISPCLGFGFSANPFVKSERKLPIDFLYPRDESFTVKFAIPEAYKAEELPTSVSFSLPDAGGKFLYSIQSIGGEIVINCKLSITRFEYSSMEYPSIKLFFDEVVKKQNEKIVLKKI